jgi:hypothetical protein
MEKDLKELPEEFADMLKVNDSMNRIPKFQDDIEVAEGHEKTPCGSLVGYSSWGQHSCGGRLYWLQRRNYEGCGLCTYYSWSSQSGGGINWNPTWNCEASKYYAPGSAEHDCFLQDNPC